MKRLLICGTDRFVCTTEDNLVLLSNQEMRILEAIAALASTPIATPPPRAVAPRRTITKQVRRVPEEKRAQGTARATSSVRDCEICGKPLIGLHPLAKVHTGACDKEKKAQVARDAYRAKHGLKGPSKPTAKTIDRLALIKQAAERVNERNGGPVNIDPIPEEER